MLKIPKEDLKVLLENGTPCALCKLYNTQDTDCTYCDGGWYYMYDENRWQEIVEKYTDKKEV